MENALVALKPLRDMRGNAELALSVFKQRVIRNFSYEMLHCLRFLDPAGGENPFNPCVRPHFTVDQRGTFPLAEREEMVSKVLGYAAAMFHRRGERVDEVELAHDLGIFIGRGGQPTCTKPKLIFFSQTTCHVGLMCICNSGQRSSLLDHH